MGFKLSEDNLRFARRVSLKVKPFQIGSFLTKMRESVYPSLKEQAGIRRMYLLSSTGGNEFLSVTLWDNKEHADSYGNSEAFAKNNEQMKDLLESDPVVSDFDIEFHDVNAADLPPPKSLSITQKSLSSTRGGKKNTKKKKST